jgi:hypothetical protein
MADEVRAQIKSLAESRTVEKRRQSGRPYQVDGAAAIAALSLSFARFETDFEISESIQSAKP